MIILSHIIGVGLSFDPSRYSVVEDHYRNTTVTIGLTANSTTEFTYIVEISVKDINTTGGMFYMVECHCHVQKKFEKDRI